MCTLFVEWNKGDPCFFIQADEKEIYGKALKNIISKIGDEFEPVFQANLELFRSIMAIVKNQIEIDIETIFKLLRIEGADKVSLIWKTAGLNIIDCLIDNGNGIFSKEQIDERVFDNMDNTLIQPENAMDNDKLDAFDLLVKPFFPAMNSQYRNLKNNPNQPTNQTGEKQMTIKKFEKLVFGIIGHTSKSFVKILGKVIGKLSSSSTEFFKNEGSNNQLALAILEAYPKINERLLILLEEIIKYNTQFYLANPCFRKILLDPQNFNNDKYALSITKIILYSLKVINPELHSEKGFLINEVFDIFSQIIKSSYFTTILLVLELLMKIIEIDFRSHANLICTSILLVWERKSKTILSNARKLFREVCQKFITQAFQEGYDFNKIASIFYLWSQTIESVEEYNEATSKMFIFGNLKTIFDIFKFLVNGSSNIKESMFSFVLHVLCSLKAETGRLIVEDVDYTEVSKFKQLVQEQLQLPSNYLSQELSERNFSQWSYSSMKNVINQSANKETLKVAIESMIKAEMMYMDDSASETFSQIIEVPVPEQPQLKKPTLQRFNKENLNRMPLHLLKKYREQNRIVHKEDPSNQNTHRKSSLINLLIEFMAKHETHVYRLFAIILVEVIKSSSNKEKSLILSTIIKTTVALSDKKMLSINMLSGFNVMNDLLYYLHKTLDVAYFIEPSNIDAINNVVSSPLTLMINEHFFLKTKDQFTQGQKHKSMISYNLDTFIDLRQLQNGDKQSGHNPLSRNDFLGNDKNDFNEEGSSLNLSNRYMSKSDNSNAPSMSQSLIQKSLDRTISTLFNMSYNTELNTFYKPYINNDKDYDMLITSVNNHIYRDIVQVIESIEDTENQSALETLMIKQKQECFAALERWDQLIELTSLKNDSIVTIPEDKTKLEIKSFTRLPLEDQEYLMHSFLMDSNYWATLKENTTSLMSIKSEKEYLEANYSSELAFLSLTVIDYDRANYYNELHKDQIKHFISTIQSKDINKVIGRINTYTKIDMFIKYVKENNYVTNDEQFDNFLSNFKLRKHNFDNCRSAQSSFSLSNVLLHLMIEKYKASDCTAINNLIIENQISFVNNLTKLNNIEASEKRLKNLLKTKTELFNDQNLTYKFMKAYTNLRQNSLHVLSDQSKIKSVVQFFSHCRPIITSEHLSYKFKLLEALFAANCIKFISFNDSSPNFIEENPNDSSQRQFLSKTQEILKIDKIVSKVCLPNQPKKMTTNTLRALNKNGLEEEGPDSENNNPMEIETPVFKQYRLNEQLSEISQHMLRLLIERKETDSANFSKLLKVYFKNTCHTLSQCNSNNHKLPFLFKLLTDFPMKTVTLFCTYSENLNPKIWLEWIPQLVRFMDQSYKYFSEPILQALVTLYPDQTARHLIFYKHLPSLQAFIRSNIATLNSYFDVFEELKFLNDPELSLLETANEIKLLVESQSYDKLPQQVQALEVLLMDLKQMKKAATLSAIMLEFKAQFKSSIKQLITNLSSASSKDSSEPTLLTLEAILANVEKIIRNRYSSNSIHKLQNYSKKLANFTSHYIGKRSVNYFMSSNVRHKLLDNNDRNCLKVIDIKGNITVMNSLRKPKKITFLCSDNKVRYLLFKSGEDLREDQRIMTIFKIFNSLLEKRQQNDTVKSRISCYEVLPIDRNHGLLEWIPHSFSFKHLIESEMHPEDLTQNAAMHQRQSFLSTLGQDPVSKHLALHKLDKLAVTQEFDKEIEYLSSGLLRKAIMKRLNTATDFLETRKRFFESYALSSLAGYLLGIGDRHLDNSLFNGKLEFYQIDFGCSFNFGLHLAIPELVPFRLTPNILAFGLPFEIEGTFKSTYLAAANIFYLNHDVLNDYVEIYLSEPVENWQKLEKRYSLLLSNDPNQMDSLTSGHQTLIHQRLAVFNRKLKGDSPRKIMIEELWNSLHKNKPHFQDLLRTLNYKEESKNAPSYKNAVEKINSSVQEAIDMATDKTLLGRMWTGWMPFV